MARHAGRNSRVYIALASGGTAEPVAFLTAFSVNAAVATVDVTAFGDSNHIYASLLPDASGDFSGFYDDATVQTYTAAVDGIARKMYLYPDIVANPAQYWYGTAFLDFKVDSSVTGAITTAATWTAASTIAKQG